MRTLSGALNFDGIENPISVKPFAGLFIAVFIYCIILIFALRKVPKGLHKPIGIGGGLLIIAAWFWLMFFK